MLNKHLGKLAIGTVQFGMNYGISNKDGQTPLDEIKRILKFAIENHIDTLDTAVGYGESERSLGQAGISQWNVVTKLPAVANDCLDISGWVEQNINDSLKRLNVSHLHGVLFHTPKQLLEPIGLELYDTVRKLKEVGIVDKIGISIYSPDELGPLFNQFNFDIVQSPFNILDRRLSNSGWLKQLAEMGVETHVRSIFLQGLLLMQSNRPPKFNNWGSLWKNYDNWLTSNNLTPLEACISHVMAYPEINKVVVGVDNVLNLTEIIKAAELKVAVAPNTLICNDANLINPSNWSVF